MFICNKSLRGMVLRATDGEIGTVSELYFDDESWAIRYLTVETGSWLGGRVVLISPASILQVDAATKRIDVSLTRKQIEDSPKIDTHKPVSRQHEAEYFAYYGYPNYWDGPYLWGPSYYPAGLALPPSLPASTATGQNGKYSHDSHLRSTEAVMGYHIQATDGEIGHVDRFLVDDEAWAIRYLEVATRNWWPGKRVMLSPSWVERVSWEESKVYVAVSREAIQTCPEYNDKEGLSRKYEHAIYDHYGRPPYWIESAKSTSAYARTGR